MNHPIPNTFIAGAPKCGTTSLAHWLSEHPDIFLPAKKEPHYFHRELNNCKDKDDYLSLFDSRPKSNKITIDASTGYFTNSESIIKIEEYNSSAKYILMLRNPIEIVRSWHSECLYLCRENIENLEDAWHLQDARKKGGKIPISCVAPSSLQYRDQALIGRSLSFLIEKAGHDRVKWIFLDDMRDNPRKTYREVLCFLGVKDDGRTAFPVLNKAKRHRFPILNRLTRVAGMARHHLGLPGFGVRLALNRVGTVERENAPMSADFQRSLYSEFRDDIAILESLTGRNLSHWNPDRSHSEAEV